MDLVRRVKDITRASLNEMLENAEDPVRYLDRYVQQQKRNIEELEVLYRDQLKHAQLLREQLLEAEEIANKREQQARLAIRAGEEQVARLALEDKMVQDDKRDRYKQLYNQAKEMLVELEDRLDTLKSDLQEVMDKRQYYSARLESLQLRKKIDATRQNRTSRTSGWFDRLEDALSDLELEVSAYDEILFCNRRRSSGIDSTKNADAIDLELEKLKQKVEADRRDTD